MSSIVVVFELGTTLPSLPFVILNRWTEKPDAAEKAVYNSSLLALREIPTSLGSLRMGFPALKLAMCLYIYTRSSSSESFGVNSSYMCNIPLG
jgi:hypothetical protein